MLTPTYDIQPLPPSVDFDTVPILKALARANRVLAELKGRAASIPNQTILIDTLALQEAKASSEIENIVTTQDDLFQAELFPGGLGSAAAKEVALYRDALKLGFDRLRASDGLLTNATLIAMFRLLKQREGGFRETPGTALKNEVSGEVVFVPPQDRNQIIKLMDGLEAYVNEANRDQLDPLVRMALIHHQFESIHPFPDGNGRIGRILNVLYLTKAELLEIPILYLSRHITRNKASYYRLLQDVRTDGAWEAWVLFMLEAVAETSEATLVLVEGIRTQMQAMKTRLRDDLPKLYSQDLLNNLFRHPYTRIDFVVSELGVSRQTAAKYLDELAAHGIVDKIQVGRNNYFINTALVQLFLDVAGGD
ncbi:MAG: Fic family protein [Albidovulum sp.]|uniref:Fic family protein n=1 Tax=Albidovulum sp. TaxID=1872424 RepID=UPI003CC13C1B